MPASGQLLCAGTVSEASLSQDVSLSPVISGHTLVPPVAQSALGKTVPWGVGRNLGKSSSTQWLVSSKSLALDSCEGLFLPARASLGRMRSWRITKVEVFVLRLLQGTDTLQVISSG